MARAAKRTVSPVHKRQQQYVRQIEREGFDYGLTVASAFVRSIRDLGYRSAATALDELVDNSVEAGASNIHILFGYGQSASEAKPVSLAIVDDGYGMVPEMIRAAVVWGGTDRENSRNLFGRYGYGLPSASVSQGQRFTVYSRTDAGEFYAVTLDVNRINDYMVGNRVVVPEAVAHDLPMWVKLYVAEHFPGGVATARTIIVWDKLDRLTWRTTTALETNLLQHFGVVYRNFLRQVDLVVNGKHVAPIDPLFATPGHRFYDFDDDRAEELPSLRVAVPVEGVSPDPEVELRISYMPPTFLSKDKTQGAAGKNANPRFAVRRDNHGFVVCRHGRQIDVVTRNPITTFLNNDRYIGLELNFPAELDEEFGITTSKQQITISQRVWDRLRDEGLERILSRLRMRWREERQDAQLAQEQPSDQARPSEAIMSAAKDIVRRRPPNAEAERQAQKNLEREAKNAARETGLSASAIRAQRNADAETRKYKVVTESLPGGAFFRVEQVGGQLVLRVNRSHRFYTDVYAPVQGTEGVRVRAGLELLLFALGQCELDSTDMARALYMSERIEWSKILNVTLTLLDERSSQVDDNEAEALVG